MGYEFAITVVMEAIAFGLSDPPEKQTVSRTLNKRNLEPLTRYRNYPRLGYLLDGFVVRIGSYV